MPEHMVRALTSRMSIEGKSKLFENIFLPRNLDQKSYSGHFKALLWAEEFRCDQDLQTYDIADATLNNFNSYYYLAVPGLAERRPSVLVGDRILIQPIGSDLQRGKWFEGRVHVVRKEEVGMKFHDSFHAAHTPTRRYRARFKLNRHSLQRQHQALDATFTPPRILFPATSSGVTIPPVAKIRPSVYNELITHNPAQLQAVSSIVHMLPKSPPFVVFGPPGTGKTMTIIESIRQILDGNANTRVLACAPSNSAADLIAQGLKMYRPDQLFRFYAPSRSKADVPTELQRHIVVTPDGHFSVPAIAALKKYRVIVTTCVSASFAHGVGIPKGHFSHIFVDEAGQATEPEVMIAIKTMANDSTNIVLSGDPKQLGPIVRSAVSRTHGLEKSYLERLMNNKTYDIQNGHGTTVVKLIKNFRSNEHILDFPNRQFYDAALQPCANRRIIDCFVGSPILVNKEFPVVFHALSGKDDREARSPSFFNILEAQQVKDYVMRLRSDRNVQISDKDIGIITPYHAQCLKIRSILRPFAEGIKVGSVEEFQGQERLVIIISTVRSSREFIEYDLRHTLGFVANPRRLNVAITRAKSLLIVVGDPSVLSLDPLWRSFLDYVHLNGGWRGEEPGWDTRVRVRENGGYDKKVRATASADMNEFVRRMETLTLDNATQEEGEMSEEEDNVDRPWHRDEME